MPIYSSGKDNDSSLLDRVINIKQRNSAWLRALENVTGVGVGHKVTGGRQTEEVCIRVYVSRKVPISELRSDQIIPPMIDGIRTDVIEGEFKIHYRARQATLVGGISVGNLTRHATGTLGALVYDAMSGENMLLSNWHVLCASPNCTFGEIIVQPGTADNGDSDDIVAYLHRFVLSDDVDGAIARLSGNRFLLPETLNLGPLRGTATVTLNETVKKAGRTSEFAIGSVTDVSADVRVDYDGVIPTHLFHNQIVVEHPSNPVSLPGDSGGLWLNARNQAIGLNFAGGNDGLRAIANPIGAVMNQLNIRFEGGVAMHHYVAL